MLLYGEPQLGIRRASSTSRSGLLLRNWNVGPLQGSAILGSMGGLLVTDALSGVCKGYKVLHWFSWAWGKGLFLLGGSYNLSPYHVGCRYVDPGDERCSHASHRLACD